MNKIRLVIQYELTTLFARKSYLRMVFLMPIIGFLVYSAAALINRGIAPEGVSAFFGGSPTESVQGVVDYAGIIREVPEEFEDKLELAASEAQAQRMTEDGRLSAYYVISSNYLQSGEILYVQRDYNFLSTENEAAALQELITWNLFSDKQLAQRYNDPIQPKVIFMRERIEKDFGGPQNFWLPYGLMLLFYLLIIGSSSMMLNSITQEKQNRVIEMLLTSISTDEMLIGKTIALGLAGLFQTIIWLGTSYTLLILSGRQFALPESFVLPPSILAWGLAYFLLGYGLYSSLMAGLGALVPNPKEGSQATLVVIFPLIVPLFFSNLVASAPNAPLFVFFSIFPLTSPISMISRMSATAIPAGQLALSIGLLTLAIIFSIRAVGRLFRAQALLSGKPFRVKEFLQAFRLHGT
ncbi:MAG: ABC transporter permease [Anaerolineae bacterium]|nr:ABC transporter permease [Anaerolineae bacterium]